MAQTLSQIKSMLAAHGLMPKKRFGQNFLHDGNKLAAILASAAIRPGDVVLEVGPGTGALSEHLLDAGATLIAVEIDRDLEPILKQRLVEPYGDRVTLLFEDVLEGKHEINPRLMDLIAGRPFKLIANLPYNVASPLIVNLVLDHPHMSRAIVMVQREVGDRLAAPPGGKDYGPLGIIVQAVCNVRRVVTLTPGCFWPMPQIDSAVIELTRLETPLTDDPHGLARLVHRLFEQRRKQIGSLLGRSTPLPAGIDPTLRAEKLSVQQLVELSRIAPARLA